MLEPKVDIKRRGVLKTAAVITTTTVAASLGVNEINHEKQLAETETFETEQAVYKTNYERHDQHEKAVAPESIPQNLDALSLEGNLEFHSFDEKRGKAIKSNVLQAKATSILIASYNNDPSSPHQILPPSTLQQLEQNNISVALGDVRYKGLDNSLSVAETRNLRLKIAEKLGISGAALLAVGEIAKQLKIDRRGFLNIAGLATITAASGLYFPEKTREELHNKLMDSMQENSPQQRIWARITTISKDMRPEELNDLFRELIQANKLMTLAENLKDKSKGTKPFIGYNWHLGHRGIEDWLRLGPEITRQTLLLFPDKIWKETLEANNNDPRMLYAIRLIQPPKNFKYQIIDSSTISHTTIDETKIRDEIYEDKILADTLRTRGIFN